MRRPGTCRQTRLRKAEFPRCDLGQNSVMQFQKYLVPIGSVILVVAAYRAYGWAGVAMAVGVLVMWLLLHFTRLMRVLQRAANRPIGYVDSAVMLNAKLKPGVTLMHVIAMTRALGELISPKDAQPELYRWTDGSQSSVSCEFLQGKLVKWELIRPVQPDGGTAGTPVATAT
jgi:hypothetical protein